jgi:AraC-like DNA-binding protein
MQEIFQKSARRDRETDLRRLGVLDAATFARYSSLRAFQPGRELAPFVSHYWVVRWALPAGVSYRPTEVLASPMVNIFFMLEEAFLYGLTTQTFEYEAHGEGVMAGATFQPGGFFPYWGRSMTDLPAHKSDLRQVFPQATPRLSRDLLEKRDEDIAAGIETLIKSKPVKASPNLATIAAISQAVSLEARFQSVREVSDHYAVPVRTLQLMFQREVGVSLKWVIMRARLLEAISEGYRQSKPDWVRIAVDLGYSSQAHFIADFKRATGRSPAEFRKSE